QPTCPLSLVRFLRLIPSFLASSGFTTAVFSHNSLGASSQSLCFWHGPAVVCVGTDSAMFLRTGGELSVARCVPGNEVLVDPSTVRACACHSSLFAILLELPIVFCQGQDSWLCGTAATTPCNSPTFSMTTAMQVAQWAVFSVRCSCSCFLWPL